MYILAVFKNVIVPVCLVRCTFRILSLDLIESSLLISYVAQLQIIMFSVMYAILSSEGPYPMKHLNRQKGVPPVCGRTYRKEAPRRISQEGLVRKVVHSFRKDQPGMTGQEEGPPLALIPDPPLARRKGAQDAMVGMPWNVNGMNATLSQGHSL